MYPYYGITGITTAEQAYDVIGSDMFDTSILPNPDYYLMLGILVSRKTLNGEPASNPNRYPKLSEVPYLLLEAPRLLNMIHYNSSSDNFTTELQRLGDKGWHNLHGFQLNMVWPNPKEIERFRNLYYPHLIVLQIGPGAYERIDKNPKILADKVQKEYADLVDYVLLDPSGGTGKGIKVDVMDGYLTELYARGLQDSLRFGIAGGLCAEAVPEVAPLLRKYYPLCVDAETNVRDERDQLDSQKSHNLIKAYKRHLASALA